LNPSLLIVDDEKTIRSALGYFFRNSGYDVHDAASGGEGIALAAQCQPDLVLMDYRLPDMTGVEAMRNIRADLPETIFVMLTAHGTISGAVEAIHAGAFDYLSKPMDMDELEMTLERALEVHRLRTENQFLKRMRPQVSGWGIVGNSPQIHKLTLMVNLLAENSDTTVLIEGESGTGKEMFARAIHGQSGRKSKPLVEVNCASLSESLLESELFGHEKGAFTDAKSLKKGLLEVADGGTLFLDEVGELSPMLQPKLLRMLETRTFRRVGGTRDINVDVRFIAATNRDLKEMVREKAFREDLYYRLSVMPITVPPLRKRGNDVLILARHFLASTDIHTGRKVTGITPECEKYLLSYRWPGNVRELRNVIERALLLCPGPAIEPENLPRELIEKSPDHINPHTPAGAPPTLDEAEKAHIQSVMKFTSGNQSNAARVLDISRSTLISKLKKYGIV